MVVCLSIRIPGRMWVRAALASLLSCVLFAGTALAAPLCTDIVGFDRYAAHATGIVVSDLHGSAQAPAFLRDLVCNLMRSGRPVLLALEYPADEQRFLDDFLGARTENPESALLASPFWSRPSQDGRSSQAMADLLVWVRQQRAMGAHIRVLAYDSEPPRAAGAGGAASFNARDAAMAETLGHAFVALAPHEVPVIFTGNVHARKTKGLPFIGAPTDSAEVEPLGYRLKDRGFLHLGIASDGGSIWACVADHCGVQEGPPPGPAVVAFSFAPSKDPAYDATYFVGPLTPSLPAVPAGASGSPPAR